MQEIAKNFIFSSETQFNGFYANASQISTSIKGKTVREIEKVPIHPIHKF